MLKEIFYTVLCCLAGTMLSAQTIKTKVIVVGGGAAGTGAAIQSAHSGVETLLIETGSRLGTDISAIDTASRLGLEKNLVGVYKKSQNLKVDKLDPALIPVVLKGWTDTVRNLKVMLNTGIQSIDKRGSNWRIRLTNGRKVKAEVIVDASGGAAAKAGAENKNGKFSRSVSKLLISPDVLYSSTLYRTAVVTDTSDNVIPLGAFISSDVENLVFAGSGNGRPGRLTEGQTAGATAAYCAFFGTTTKKINTRVVQGELMAYGLWLLPFEDIDLKNPHFAAVQHIGATGILKGSIKSGKLYFMPENTVSSDEIRPELKAYYMRSQIWEPERKIDELTLNDVLNLIKIAGHRGEELNREVEKNWNGSLGFSGKYDLEKPVSRLEFAVLLDIYLQPFSVRIDPQGRVSN